MGARGCLGCMASGRFLRCGNGSEGSGERRGVEEGVVGSEGGNGGAGMKVK